MAECSNVVARRESVADRIVVEVPWVRIPPPSFGLLVQVEGINMQGNETHMALVKATLA